MGLGYSPLTVRRMLAIAGGLGRWMDGRGVEPRDLDGVLIAEFLGACRTAGMRCVPGPRGLCPLLDYLKHQGVLTESAPPALPVEALVDRYRRWLVVDRGLAEVTVVRYVKLARSVLQEWLGDDGKLDSLTGPDIVAFLLAESDRLSVGSVKGRVAELRSLLRFLYLAGLTPRPMGNVVPPVAGWRDTGIPKAIPATNVQRLLDSCDRTDPVGMRDFAMLMLVSRLGLRSIEVARLELGDIDWRAGQITLRGKAGRDEAMPFAGRCRAGVGGVSVPGASHDADPRGVPGVQGAHACHRRGAGRRCHAPGLRSSWTAQGGTASITAHAGHADAPSRRLDDGGQSSAASS
jgi:integrase